MQVDAPIKINAGKTFTPLISAGIFLGIGFSGFVDGIFLHKILQWHHMLSNIKPLINQPNIDMNMVWDGLFDVFDLIMTGIGLIFLWLAGERDDVIWSRRVFVGAILIGAGLFDFVEGIIDHQILGIHHVKPGVNQLAWDLGFLGFAVFLMIIGAVILSDGKNRDSRNSV